MTNQFKSYYGKSYKDGIANYTYNEAYFMIRNCKKLQVYLNSDILVSENLNTSKKLSFKGNKNYKIYDNVCFEEARSWLKNDSNKIQVNNLDNNIDIGCVVIIDKTYK